MKTLLILMLLLALSNLILPTEAKCTMEATSDVRSITYSCINSSLSHLDAISNNADWIEFQISRIPEIPAGAFSRFPLVTLAFYNCHLNEISPDAFQGLDQLETLNIYNSKISELKPSWFRDLRNLRRLNLDRNNLGYIDPSTFLKIPHLESLSLADNDLNCLSGPQLSSLTKLKQMTIEDNPWLCGCLHALTGWLDEHKVKYGNEEQKKKMRRDCMIDIDNAAPGNLIDSSDFSYGIGTDTATSFENVTVTALIKEEKSLTSSGKILCCRDDLSILSQLPFTTEWIRFNGTNVPGIPGFTFFNFSNNLRSLEFINSNVQEIHSDAFASLAKLNQLNLTGNNFMTVKTHWFKDLFNLRMLILDRNNIEFVESGVFHVLCNLEFLSIEHNLIKNFAVHELLTLQKLRHVKIANNPLDCSCQDDLDRLTAVKKVDVEMTRSQCPQVPSPIDVRNWKSWWEENSRNQYIFKTNITRTDTFTTGIHSSTNCLLREVETGIARNVYYCSGGSLADYERFPNGLNAIIFSGTQIPIIRNNAFKRFGHTLRVLEFHNCSIQEIEPQAFSGLSSLDYLIFDNNNFTTVKTQWFKDLYNLKSLALAGSSIKTVEDGVFSGLPSLQLISLKGNRLECINAASLFSLQNLYAISIDDNPWNKTCLTKLIQQLFQSNVRHEMKLSHSSYSYTIKENNNGVTIIDDNEPSEKIIIAPGECVEEEPESNGKGIHVYCTGGQVSMLNNLSSNTEWIILNNTFVPTLSRNAFAKFPNLTRLEFHSCHLHYIHPEAFAKLHKLEWLGFYHNNLQMVKGDWFNDLHSLKHLYLVRSQVAEIQDEVFEKLGQVETFSVEGNKLRCIYTKRLNLMKNLTNMEIMNNPWKQHCEQEQKEFFRHHGINFTEPLLLPPQEIRRSACNTKCSLATTQTSMLITQVLCIFALMLFRF